MVGRKKDEMAPVSVAITSVGQVTIPKVFRDALGWEDRVLVEKKGNTVVLRREKSYRERLEEIDKSWTPEERKRIQENAGKTAHELMEESLETEEGRKFAEEWFGEKF